VQTDQWYQEALVPPEVVEVRIRLGVIPTTDHAQVLVEVLNPVTGVLIAQWSAPHQRLREWPSLLELATHKADELLGAAVEPF
jgi:hypothetical protein